MAQTPYPIPRALNCVTGYAERVEPSGASPSVIAKEALRICQDAMATADVYLLRHPEIGVSLNRLRQNAIDAATSRVVMVRRCRDAKDCAAA
jgi:hypothetical protein